MPVISLPEMPKERDFEDFIAAHFASAGLYVERSVVLKDGVKGQQAEILELDLNVTDYQKVLPTSRIIEIKSGSWGMGEVFKVRGWMHLLDYLDGGFIIHKDRQNMETYRKVAESLGVKLTSIPDLSQTPSILTQEYGIKSVDARDVSAWRFAYWMEQALVERLKKGKSEHIGARRFIALDHYYQNIHDGIFFCPTFLERTDALYRVFMETPRISARTAHEMNGEAFDADYSNMPQDVFERTFYNGELNELQISVFLEHLARLSILRTAVDYEIYRRGGETKRTEDTREMGGVQFPVSWTLPGNFQEALSQIRNDKYLHLYPIFWQWFLCIFGGFIMKDYEESDYALLAEKTGVPIDHIPNALSAYEKMFPTPNGWYRDIKHPPGKKLNLAPIPFMGLGMFYRRLYYASNKDWQGLSLTGNHSWKNVGAWVTCGARALRESKRYAPPE